MEILYKSYHGINVEENNIEHREITDDFNKIIKEMLNKIMNNPSVKRYKTLSADAVVASYIRSSMSAKDKENAEDLLTGHTDAIASKLLREEVRVLKHVKHLKGIQKGSLIQALVRSEEGNYKYLIAKVEHTNYVDEIELVLKGGFNPDENKIWKTCIFSCDELDRSIKVEEAKVYLNNTAVYWTQDFLELVELKSDEKNTRDAWNAIEKVLIKDLKKNAISDYFVLRNAVVNYFRRPRNISYSDMIDDIFNTYTPMDIDETGVSDLKKKLLKLPEDYEFDTNFVSKPSEVKAKIKSVHKVNKNIDLIIRAGLGENIDDYKEIIHIEKANDGNKWLKIMVTDQETLKAFDIKR